MSSRTYMRRPGLPPASKSLLEALALEGNAHVSFKAGHKVPKSVSRVLAMNIGQHKLAWKQPKTTLISRRPERQACQQQKSEVTQSSFASQVFFDSLAIDGAALSVLTRKSSGTKARQKMTVLPEMEEQAVQPLPVVSAIREQAEQPMPELPSPNEQAEKLMPELPSLDEQASPVMSAHEISKQALSAALSCDTSYQDSCSHGSSVSVASDSGQDGEVPGAGAELALILRLRHALTEQGPSRQCSFDDVDFDGGTRGFGGATGCVFGAGAGEGYGAEQYPETEVQPPKKLQPLHQRSMSARLDVKLKARSCCHGGG